MSSVESTHQKGNSQRHEVEYNSHQLEQDTCCVNLWKIGNGRQYDWDQSHTVDQSHPVHLLRVCPASNYSFIPSPPCVGDRIGGSWNILVQRVWWTNANPWCHSSHRWGNFIWFGRENAKVPIRKCVIWLIRRIRIIPPYICFGLSTLEQRMLDLCLNLLMNPSVQFYGNL